MPTTTRPSSTRSSSSARLLWLDPADISPNPWNPNVVPQDLLDKVREAIVRFGWLSPVVVRSTGDHRWQLVDGEHRWQIAKDEGLGPIPAFLVDGLSESEAKRATVILNDLHGQARPDRLAALVADVLASGTDVSELLVGFPYSEDALAALTPLPSLPVGPLPDAPPPGARWVERTYRLSPEAAEVLDDALAKAKNGEEMSDAQAIELIAADFLSGL